jgi:hypothetical protein
MQYASPDLIEVVVQKPLASDPKAPTHCRPRSGPFIANEMVVYTFVAGRTVRSMPS